MKQVNSSKLSYRAEIDGLRAIAIISVILYHAKMVLFGMDWFEGGFIGVDIFFVISGYLITRIILSELQTKGSFSFLNFYERRARRILPMLLVVIFVSIPYAWQRLLPSDFVEYAESIVAALFFGSNFFFYFSTTEYGADSALLKPFLHTWSLGVEEQFYLVFPVLAVLAFKFFRAHFLTILVTLSLMSLLFAELMDVRNSDLNFYLPFSRFWELAVGSVLAYRELNYKVLDDGFGKRIVPMLGFLLVAYSILFFDQKTPHPSFHTLIPILGVALIIGFASKDDLVGKLLSSKPFVWIGLISYSAYLWHFLLFSFTHIKHGIVLSSKKTFVLLGLTFLYSIISYFLVERRFRSKNKISTKSFVYITFMISISVILLASYSIYQNGFSDRFFVLSDKAKTDMLYYRKEYWDDYGYFFNKEKNVLKNFSSVEDDNIYVIGNSWGHDIAVSLAKFTNFNVQFESMSGHVCNEFTLPKMMANDRSYSKWFDICSANLNRFRTVPKNTDIVIIADNIFQIDQYSDSEVLLAFKDNLAALRKNFDGKVVVVKGRPTWNKRPYELIIRKNVSSLSPSSAQSHLRIKYSELIMIDQYYKNFYVQYGVNYIGLNDALCDDKVCKLFSDQKPLFFDKFHLTLDGAEYVSEFLNNKLLSLRGF